MHVRSMYGVLASVTESYWRIHAPTRWMTPHLNRSWCFAVDHAPVQDELNGPAVVVR